MSGWDYPITPGDASVRSLKLKSKSSLQSAGGCSGLENRALKEAAEISIKVSLLYI
jgi:hypothetical protein